MSLKDKYAIVGLGLTKQGRLPGTTAETLRREAVQLAIEDAGLKRGDIDGYLYQPDMFSTQMAMELDDSVPRHLGLPVNFFLAMQAGGATANSMVHTAVGLMEAGLANYVAIAYADNLLTGGKPIGGLGGGTATAFGLLGPASYHAMLAKRHMINYGTTSKQFGAIAVTQREYAATNPEAFYYGKPMTIEDHQNSRMITEPLHMLDCCLITDGGAALIVTSAERAKDLKRPPVYIMGMGQGHQMKQLLQKEEYTTLAVQQAKEKAFKMAGIDIKDIDVAELYDCFTITVLQEIEGYGFCKRGEGGPFVEAGNLKIDGAIPTNTSGGELSWTYLVGFSPLTEGIRQTRGDCGPRQVKNAEICLVGGHGGMQAGSLNPMTTGHATLILRR